MALAKPAKRTTGRTTSKPAVKSIPPADADSVEDTKVMKRKELLAAVSARSSLPRSDLRAVTELVLDELGRALDSGHDLALPPLGRLKVQKRKTGTGAEVITLRLRRKGPVEAVEGDD